MSTATADSFDGPVTEPITYRFAFHGNGTSFFLIFLKNVLLTLVTFGVYFAWAKTERRKYVWNNLEFHDQLFRYTGTGIELFKGYLVVLAAYLLFFGAPRLVDLVVPGGGTFVEVLVGLGIFIAVPFLIYRSRAFLYNRTVWRGIRFGLLPGAGPYGRTFMTGILLSLVTFGFYSPIMTNRLHRIITENTRFGSLEFHYTGSDRDAFWLGVKGLLLTAFTLGLYLFWYSAEITRFQCRNTQVGTTAHLHSDLTGADLLLLFLLAIFGTTLSLGLAFPWITMYSIRLVADRTSVVGVIDFDEIEQRAQGGGAAADGFADLFDIDLGL